MGCPAWTVALWVVKFEVVKPIVETIVEGALDDPAPGDCVALLEEVGVAPHPAPTNAQAMRSARIGRVVRACPTLWTCWT